MARTTRLRPFRNVHAQCLGPEEIDRYRRTEAGVESASHPIARQFWWTTRLEPRQPQTQWQDPLYSRITVPTLARDALGTLEATAFLGWLVFFNFRYNL